MLSQKRLIKWTCTSSSGLDFDEPSPANGERMKVLELLDKVAEEALIVCVKIMGLECLRGGGGAKSSKSVSSKLGALRFMVVDSACGMAFRNISRTVCLP